MKEIDGIKVWDFAQFYVPHFQWLPVAIIAAGLAHYYWYKYVTPYPEDLLERLDSFSLSGNGGNRYRPYQGLVISIVGLIVLIIVNYEWLVRIF